MITKLLSSPSSGTQKAGLLLVRDEGLEPPTFSV